MRGVRASAYATYLARWAGVALSVGITTSPCEMRAAPPSGCLSRNAVMCDSWMVAKSSPAQPSGARTTLLHSRFIPCSPAHAADRTLPAPYHIRPRSPGDCGCTLSENSSIPATPRNELACPPSSSRSSRSTRS